MIFYEWYPILLIPCIFNGIGFSIGLGGTMVIFVNETLPSAATGFVLFFFWQVGTVGMKLYPIMSDEFGPDNVIMSMVFCNVIGFLFIVGWVRETKGKSIEEIEKSYEKCFRCS